MFFKIDTNSYRINRRLKNSLNPSLEIPKNFKYVSGIMNAALIDMITSIHINATMHIDMATFLIAPSIPNAELNSPYLIALNTPNIVSSTMHIKKILKKEMRYVLWKTRTLSRQF